MKCIATLLICLILCLALTGAPALATDYTFNVTSGIWELGTNWTPTGIPGAGDKATIPAAKTCTITSSGTAAEVIDVESGLSDGLLQINIGAKLALGASGSTSTVDGKLLFHTGGSGDDAELVIKNDLTINGSGSIEGNLSAGLITYATTNYRLTIDGTVVLSGEVTVECKFTNSATVEANSTSGVFVLASGSIPQGNGDWKVTDADAKLRFQDSATGGALSGDFIIGGTLDIDQNVYTTGDLTLQEDGVIEVASGMRFKASALGL